MFRFVLRKIGRKVALTAAAVASAVALAGMAVFGEVTSRAAVVVGLAVTTGLVVTLVAVRQMVILRLRRLGRVMERAESGDVLIRARVDSPDEIGELARRFNVMLARLTDLAATQIDAEREKEHMRRELELQSQLTEKSVQLTRRVEDLELLIDVAQAIASSLELDSVLARIREALADRLGFQEFALLLYQEEAGEYEVAECHGFGSEMRGLRFRDDEGVISVAHREQRTVLVPDVGRDPRYLYFKGRRKGDGSLLVVPILYRHTVVGTLTLSRPEIDAFTQDEVRLIETVAAQAAVAISHARLYQRTVRLSLTDPLTGLCNRRHLEQRLEMEVERARRFGHPLSVLMIDIDNFKRLNDVHGHVAGDRVLRELGALLKGAVRRVDTVARYGGEEFTVLLPAAPGANAWEVAEKLRHAIEARAFVLAGDRPAVHVTVSIGMATWPDGDARAEELLHRADAALYHAKDTGRNRVQAWTPALGDETGHVDNAG